jgi:dTDP-4-dehydrorhamnose reductase
LYKKNKITVKSKKIYIAGCGGMLGEAFYCVFGKEYELKCTDIDINEKWLSYLDFRDYPAYLKDVIGYNLIICFI